MAKVSDFLWILQDKMQDLIGITESMTVTSK